MVHARLHVICGNCGSTKLEYRREEICKDAGDQSCLFCHDCATRHSLQDINPEDRPEGRAINDT